MENVGVTSRAFQGRLQGGSKYFAKLHKFSNFVSQQQGLSVMALLAINALTISHKIKSPFYNKCIEFSCQINKTPFVGYLRDPPPAPPPPKHPRNELRGKSSLFGSGASPPLPTWDLSNLWPVLPLFWSLLFLHHSACPSSTMPPALPPDASRCHTSFLWPISEAEYVFWVLFKCLNQVWL